MKNTLLKALLKSKTDKQADIEVLIDDYLKQVKKETKKQTESIVGELIVYVLQHVEEMSKELLLQVIEQKVKQFGISVPTQSFDEIYKKSAEAAAQSVGIAFAFEKVDTEVMESMYRAITWMKDDGTIETQQKLKETIAAAMDGEIDINDLGEVLRERLGDVVDGTSSYFQSVSEHVIRQSQSLTRLYQFDKAGIEKVKVVAVVDNRTSKICLSMHGRIIPLLHAKSQADAITAAKTVEEKKEVARWQSQPVFGKLPSNVALPPYHFRCRTIVVAYFSQKAEIDGKNVNGSFLPGETYKGKEVLFSHVDKFGYERVVTKQSIDHGGTYHGLKHKEIIAGLNSMEQLALHATEPARTVGYSKEKDLFFSFEAEEVVTVFQPKEKQKYFKKYAQEGTIHSISMKKGIYNEES